MDVQAPLRDYQSFYFKDFESSYIPQILKEIYIDAIYHKFLVGKRNLTICDWGANIGLTAYYFSKYAQKVYAVEPAKSHYTALGRMILQCGIDNIVICPYAIGNTDTKSKFYHNDNTTMYSLKDSVNKKDDFEMVEVLTAETFLSRNKIDTVDFLKMDLEGFESEVIASESFRKVAHRFKVIVGEWHSWGAMGKGAFMDCFDSLGFQFNWLGNTEATVFSAVRL